MHSQQNVKFDSTLCKDEYILFLPGILSTIVQFYSPWPGYNIDYTTQATRFKRLSFKCGCVRRLVLVWLYRYSKYESKFFLNNGCSGSQGP